MMINGVMSLALGPQVQREDMGVVGNTRTSNTNSLPSLDLLIA